MKRGLRLVIAMLLCVFLLAGAAVPKAEETPGKTLSRLQPFCWQVEFEELEGEISAVTALPEQGMPEFCVQVAAGRGKVVFRGEEIFLPGGRPSGHMRLVLCGRNAADGHIIVSWAPSLQERRGVQES